MAKTRRGGKKKASKKAAKTSPSKRTRTAPSRVARKTASKKTSAKKTASKKKSTTKKSSKKAAPKKTSKKKVAKKTAKKAAPKKAAKKKAAPKKAASKKTASKKAAPKKKTPAKKSPPKKAAASKKAAPKKPASKAKGAKKPGNVPDGWGAHEDAGLTNRQLKHLYNRLVEERDRKLAELQRHMQEALGEAGVMTDETDMAQRHTEQAYLIRFADKERKLLNEIQRALDKLRNHEYGVCEGTEEPIGFKRLELRPWTRYSVAYKEQIERERSQHRR